MHIYADWLSTPTLSWFPASNGFWKWISETHRFWVWSKGCLHDIGASFIPVRVHSSSLLWLCIRLHDTNTKCHAGASHTGASHTGASHTGASSPRFLCRSEIFILAWKFIPVSCKRVWLFVSYPLKFHQFYGTIRLAPQQTRLYATFHLAPEWKLRHYHVNTP